jgi:small subunit ribosomal protein S15
MPLAKEVKTKLIQDFHRHDTDTGSPEVQVALLSARIDQLTEHLAAHKKDHHTRRGLLRLVGKRRQEFDFVHGKRARAIPVDYKSADCFVF